MSMLSFLLVPALVGLCEAHGAAFFPASRQWLCSGGASPNNRIGWNGRGSKLCEDLNKEHYTLNNVVTDWSGVSNNSGASGNYRERRQRHIDQMGEHAALCSAARVKYEVLANPSAYNLWKTRSTDIEAGEHTFIWKASAPHATAYYDVYITKDGWNDKAPITWDSLQTKPICYAVMKNKKRPEVTTKFNCTIPKGKQGQHVIFQVWQRSDSSEAFYSCSDVRIGDGDETSTVSTFSSAASNAHSRSSAISSTIRTSASTATSSTTTSSTLSRYVSNSNGKFGIANGKFRIASEEAYEDSQSKENDYQMQTAESERQLEAGMDRTTIILIVCAAVLLAAIAVWLLMKHCRATKGSERKRKILFARV